AERSISQPFPIYRFSPANSTGGPGWNNLGRGATGGFGHQGGPLGLSRTLDTAGELVWSGWDGGFAFPAGSILPRFRQNGPGREFASSITLDDVGRSPASNGGRSRGKWDRGAGWRAGVIESAREPRYR